MDTAVPHNIHVSRCTLKRICKVSGLPWDPRVSELRSVYSMALAADWQAVYTDAVRDISKFLSKETSLHRLTTPEELYRTTVLAETLKGKTERTFGGDLIFIGSHTGCDFIIEGIPRLALIIATLPRINRILIIDPGSECGYSVISPSAVASQRGKRVFSTWSILETLSIRVHTTTFTVFAK